MNRITKGIRRQQFKIRSIAGNRNLTEISSCVFEIKGIKKKNVACLYRKRAGRL